jgi:FKBP-type peptidyl-prolyl cis-trans isomerase
MTTTASGLQYKVLAQGSGPMPVASSTVTVHYRGCLLNGTQFDSSFDRGQPSSFPLSNVIPGWTEGLQLMPQGSRYLFYIPSELAYGAQGRAPSIAPNTPLLFEVELLGFQ